MRQSIESQMFRRVRQNGPGWAFSSKDFGDLGTRSAIDVALKRLCEKGAIRRVIRGIYDYPRTSKSLGQQLSADVGQIARALARKFGWRIQPTGPAALNLLGLSTQVMGQIVYLSDGPDRTYRVGNQTITFARTALRESGFELPESSLLVQALRTLGKERINDETIAKLRARLEPERCSRILKDTRAVRGWVHDAIVRICQEGE